MQMFTSCVKVATTCRSKLFKGTHLFSPIDSWNLLAISGLGTVRLYTVERVIQEVNDTVTNMPAWRDLSHKRNGVCLKRN